MKISFLCLAIYAYVAYASEDSESESRKPVAHHAVQNNAPNQGYVPYGSSAPRPVYRPQPVYYPSPPQPRPQPRRRSSLNLSNPIILYLLLKALTPKTTTAATTMAPVTTVTPDPLAGCTQVGNENCYYCLSETSETWNAADAACKAKMSVGRLAVTGLNVDSTARKALIDAIPATGVTFWVGVDGVITTGSVSPHEFIAPLNGVNVVANDPPGFTVSTAEAGTIDPACGRLDAVNTDALVFEACDGPARRYLCEICL